jgi:hypothetical protein
MSLFSLLIIAVLSFSSCGHALSSLDSTHEQGLSGENGAVESILAVPRRWEYFVQETPFLPDDVRVFAFYETGIFHELSPGKIVVEKPKFGECFDTIGISEVKITYQDLETSYTVKVRSPDDGEDDVILGDGGNGGGINIHWPWLQ